MIMGNLRSSLARELERFFNTLPRGTKIPTDSAFCQARMKVRPEAFCDINEIVVNRFYAEGPIKRLKGYRVCAIDGSTARLRGVKETCARAFAGDDGWDPESGTALARISICEDILNDVAVDAMIASYKDSEQALAAGHVSRLGEGDLTLWDRNYGSYRLFRDLENRRIKFCARIKIKQWTRLLGDFVRSADEDRIIQWQPDGRQRAECIDLEIPVDPLTLRLVKVVLNTGEIEVLITNLLDRQLWTTEDIATLYSLRWGAEEQYKLSKIRSEIERWSGKSDRAVEQDFYGRIILENLSSMLSAEAQKVVKTETAHCQYKYQVNRTRALSITREVLYDLLVFPHRLLDVFHTLTARYVLKPCPIRPGRKYPRNFRPKADFSFPYKALA